MLSSDVAKLYKVETKVLNQTIKRNVNRFPNEFCFQLADEEIAKLSLRSQFVTLNKSNNLRGQHYKYLPYALTEQGIMMLSGLLRSDVAVEVNIKIIDAFVKMRYFIKDSLIEQKYINNMVIEHDSSIKLLQEAFNKLEEKRKVNEIYFNGQIYDAYSKIKDIFFESKEELIIIDNYADKKILDMIKNINTKVIIITKENNKLSKLDIEEYNKQYHNLSVIYDNTFHDRYFIIDRSIFYHSGTSVNYIGSKTFSINILEDVIVKDSLLNKIKKDLSDLQCD